MREMMISLHIIFSRPRSVIHFLPFLHCDNVYTERDSEEEDFHYLFFTGDQRKTKRGLPRERNNISPRLTSFLEKVI